MFHFICSPVLPCNKKPAPLENCPSDAALFKAMTSLNFFFFFQHTPAQPEHGRHPLPKLTSNTKQQLLFHGCVQAEPGHLHWVTGLLAVFVVSSKVCTSFLKHIELTVKSLRRFALNAGKCAAQGNNVQKCWESKVALGNNCGCM